jgi:hypothetical protein
MTTARTIITSALGNLGVKAEGQQIGADDIQLSLSKLNDLLDSWAIEALYAFSTTEYTGRVTGTTVSIGPTGDVVTPYVPTRIEKVFSRLGNLDRPIELVTYSEFADISLKSNAGPFPATAHYNAAGTLFLYPPASSTEIHVGVYERLAEFATVDTDYTLRPGVRRTLGLSLAEELAPAFGTPVNPALVVLASKARRMLKRSNHVVPQLGDGIKEAWQLYPPGFSGDHYDGAIDPT